MIGQHIVRLTREQVFDSAPVARTFADDNLAGAGCEERGGSPRHDDWMRIDRGPRFVLDHVGFQEHPLAGNGWTKELQAAIDEIPEIDAIVGRRKKRHRRTIWHDEIVAAIRPAPARRGAGRQRQRGEERTARQSIR